MLYDKCSSLRVIHWGWHARLPAIFPLRSFREGKGSRAPALLYTALLGSTFQFPGPASPLTAPLPRLPAAAHALNKKQYPPPTRPHHRL